MEKTLLTEHPWYVLQNADEVPSPALLIYPDRVKSNIRQMLHTAGGAHRLRPHVKTHKMAEIIKLQMKAGIYKFKCATISETEMVAGCGGRDILLALQLVGPNLERFLQLKQKFPKAKISCIADSEEIIDRLSQMSVNSGLETHVWLDINNGMNRSGIQPGEDAVRLMHKIIDRPMLRLGGLHVYDGHIREKDIAKREKRCNDAFAPVKKMMDALIDAGNHNAEKDPVNIIAGGTTTFTIHARREDVECSPGTPLLWDDGYQRLFPDMEFRHAAVLFTRIISKPAKNLICLDLGHKAVASEMPHPRVNIFGLKDYDMVVHSEEHMVLQTADADKLNVGDSLYGIPWHICPTVDRHDTVSVVKDHRVTEHWDVMARKRIITI